MMKIKLNKKFCHTERSRGACALQSLAVSLLGHWQSNLRILSLLLIVGLTSCQKEIDVKIPDYVQKLVVEGRIENGSNPEVFLSYTIPYFGNHTQQNLADFAVKGALVTVYDGTSIDTLKDITMGNGYWYRASNMIGAVGKTYALTIVVNGKTYTSQTTIHPQVKLDTLWFKVLRDDSLGFIYTHFTEPAGIGNSYRWLAKRIGKDQNFIAPIGSAFDDKFIDGKSFDFAYNRGHVQNSTATDDNNNERDFFKKNDQVIVKFCSIGYDEFRFFRSYDANIISNGNPFAAPTNLENNVHGENVIGVWCGYNAFIDTLICK